LIATIFRKSCDHFTPGADSLRNSVFRHGRTGFASACLVFLVVSLSYSAPLGDTIDSLIALEPLRGSSWSILFAEADGPLEYAARDADRLLIPASVTKLWTTATALDELGAETRLTTKVVSATTLDGQGTLSGDLICIGGGDPAFEMKSRKDLGGPALDKLADQLKSKGLKRVTGNLIVCTGRYDRTCGNGVWEMGDLREGFAPAVDGAGFNSNVCNVKIAPGGSEGDTSVVSFDPPFAPISVINHVLTASSGNDSWVEFNVTPCRDELELTGVMARGDEPQYIWFPIQEPALYFGLGLRDALARKGITVGGQVLVRNDMGPAAPNVLVEFSSPPVAELIATVNKESDNYIAEYLLAAVGAKKYGQGSTEAGLRAVQSYAREQGIVRDQVSLQDGCGLSRQNLVSARACVQLLQKVGKSAQGATFEASLSQGGVDGTLGGRFGDADMNGRVRGKTGTMTHVSSLAGYIGLDSGKRLAFAIICNNFRCSRHYVRNTQDQLVRAAFNAVNGGQ